MLGSSWTRVSRRIASSSRSGSVHRSLNSSHELVISGSPMGAAKSGSCSTAITRWPIGTIPLPNSSKFSASTTAEWKSKAASPHSPDQTVSNPPAAMAHRHAGGRADLDVPQTSQREPLNFAGVLGGGSPPRRGGISKGRAFDPSTAGGKADPRESPRLPRHKQGAPRQRRIGPPDATFTMDSAAPPPSGSAGADSSARARSTRSSSRRSTRSPGPTRGG